MQHFINYLYSIPASSYYHALAFLGTAFLTQYSVQLIKLVSKNKLGKTTLRFLNGAFNVAFVSAGAAATGGISLGGLTVSAAALSTFSAVIYRIHANTLYKQLSNEVQATVDAPVTEPVPEFAS